MAKDAFSDASESHLLFNTKVTQLRMNGQTGYRSSESKAIGSLLTFGLNKKRVARLTTNHPLAINTNKKHSAKTTNNKNLKTHIPMGVKSICTPPCLFCIKARTSVRLLALTSVRGSREM